MNPNAVKQLVIFVLCCVAAVVVGSLVASQDSENLLLLSYLVVGIYVLAAPGFVPLLAFGILNPFVLPIPFIHNVPFMMLILGVCFVKLFFHKALARQRAASPYQHCLTRGFFLFFGWIALRYFMN